MSTSQVAYNTNLVGKFRKMKLCRQTEAGSDKLTHTFYYSTYYVLWHFYLLPHTHVQSGNNANRNAPHYARTEARWVRWLSSLSDERDWLAQSSQSHLPTTTIP